MANLYDDIFGVTPGSDRINSKKKGDSNERVAAKWLTDWVGVKFTRVPSSGGLRWTNTVNACGDIVCEDGDFDFLFSVETKHLKNLSIAPTLRVNSKIFTIWNQAVTDAIRANKFPMCLLRSNGMASGTYYVIISSALFDSSEIDLDPIFRGFNEDYSIIGYTSNDFKEKVSYEALKSLI